MKDVIKTVRSAMTFLLLVVLTWAYFPFALLLTFTAIILGIPFILRYTVDEGWEYILEKMNRENTPGARRVQKTLMFVLSTLCWVMWIPNFLIRLFVFVFVATPVFMGGYGLHYKKAWRYKLLLVPLEVTYRLCQDYLDERYFKTPPRLS